MLRRINRQRVAFLDHFRAAFGQFGAQGHDALAFLHAQAAEVGKLITFYVFPIMAPTTIAVIMLSPSHDVWRSSCLLAKSLRQYNELVEIRVNLPT